MLSETVTLRRVSGPFAAMPPPNVSAWLPNTAPSPDRQGRAARGEDRPAAGAGHRIPASRRGRRCADPIRRQLAREEEDPLDAVGVDHDRPARQRLDQKGCQEVEVAALVPGAVAVDRQLVGPWTEPDRVGREEGTVGAAAEVRAARDRLHRLPQRALARVSVVLIERRRGAHGRSGGHRRQHPQRRRHGECAQGRALRRGPPGHARQATPVALAGQGGRRRLDGCLDCGDREGEVPRDTRREAGAAA